MKNTNLPELCVTGLGLVTSVGHDHKTACASIRAGLKRSQLLGNYYLFTKKPLEDPDDGYVGGHPVLDGHYDDRDGRMVDLLSMAFLDLSRQENWGDLLAEAPLWLALPENERHTVDDLALKKQLKDCLAIPWDDEGFRWFQNGHAGMIVALAEAAKAMSMGMFHRVLIAGADSLIGVKDLRRFNRLGRLKTALNPAGFMPGEAASVMVLETLESARQRKANIHFQIRSFALATEEKTVLSGNPQGGDGLSRAISSLLGQEKQAPHSLDALISDMNGETYRADELSIVYSRVMGKVDGEKNMIFPARCIGDTGAASPGVAFCVAARAMERGYLARDSGKGSGNALILASSDTGERGAVLVGRNINDTCFHTPGRSNPCP